MNVGALAERLALEPLTGDLGLDAEVTGGYVGDLLSRVMAHAQQGSIWVTVQAHPNVVAVATVVGLGAVVVVEGVAIDPVTLGKAREERIPILTTPRPAFAIVADLAAAGVRAST